MNKWTEVFAAMLDLIEFELVKYEDGYGLIDLQGANLGGIEGDRFQTAAEIIDRLDVYIRDYYLDDLDEELIEYFKAPEWVQLKKGTPKAWVTFRKMYEGYEPARKFIEDHKHEIDVMDLIVNHLEEVKLDEITVSQD